MASDLARPGPMISPEQLSAAARVVDHSRRQAALVIDRRPPSPTEPPP